MKFGDYLLQNQNQAWREDYLDYDALKGLIKVLEDQLAQMNTADLATRGTSLTVPPQTNASGMPVLRQSTPATQEDFYRLLEKEMSKIEVFTKTKVKAVRAQLAQVESQLAQRGDASSSSPSSSSPHLSQLSRQVGEAGEEFLQLEKYVNLNFMGFHKILKKHDRRLPNPCKAFYVGRLYDQSWVRGDFSDVFVKVSRLYSQIRGDDDAPAAENSRQDFVRSTRKYWVHTEDISHVKYIILQHLPVLLQKSMGGETDSQLVNSIYIDNYAMELYHGRLDKTPGAIALRFRWYGTGTPETAFVERKTHREKWAQEISVKERFVVPEKQVLPLLTGAFDIKAEAEKMRSKGKSEEDIRGVVELASEVQQAISSKQLRPVMRTQYMRTAFQHANDATVRISIDTNLCMINERSDESAHCVRWYRNPDKKVPLNEITRFPHAVLEVKLQLKEEGATPQWVRELLESGMLQEVHKFSKFIHGCAVLLPEDVQAQPYWIDDVTLRDSIEACGSAAILDQSKGANEHYQHLLPHDEKGNPKVPKKSFLHQGEDQGAHSSVVGAGGGGSQGDNDLDLEEYGLGWDGVENGCWGENGAANACIAETCDWAMAWKAERITAQKVEPKLFFANERTFIHWLHNAVLLTSISVGVLAFGHSDSKSCPPPSRGSLAPFSLPSLFLTSPVQAALTFTPSSCCPWPSSSSRTQLSRTCGARGSSARAPANAGTIPLAPSSSLSSSSSRSRFSSCSSSTMFSFHQGDSLLQP
jgi:SPX domain protein involved in polyphosphate accumulation